jgi:hypothetical protein
LQIAFGCSDAHLNVFHIHGPAIWPSAASFTLTTTAST